jgi:YVTN family beta-propeller protein
VKVYKTGTSAPEQVATMMTGALPHGIWPSDDGTRIYIALENGDGVDVIDTAQQKVIATIKSGQMPRSSSSRTPRRSSAINLEPLKRAVENIQLKFMPPAGTGKPMGNPMKKFCGDSA